MSEAMETDANLGASEADLRAEIVRLNKVVQALMDRAEHGTSVQGSDYCLFQTAIVLEEQVRQRTAELEAALRENEKITRSLRESEAKFRSLVDQSIVGITIVEAGRFSYANAKFAEIFGYEPDEVLQLSPRDIVSEDDWPIVNANMRKRLSGETERVAYVFRGVRKEGDPVDVEVHGATVNANGKTLLITIFMDVTERIRSEMELKALYAQLREQAIHDPLTGLFNRRYLEETLGRELARAERLEQPVSLIMGDLDYFKTVNDRYGHLAGDEVLRVFGHLLQHNARESDIFCRYGGEEFLLVLPGLSIENAGERAEQLRTVLASMPINIGSIAIQVTASFGVAAYPQHGRSPTQLIAAADEALYAAKENGRNQVRTYAGAAAVKQG
jgi:diguanylate cyclase (GGDEF)-like protein/PAS domain S-box-containing protein